MQWLIALFGVAFRWGLMNPTGRRAMIKALRLARNAYDNTGALNRRVINFLIGAMGGAATIDYFESELTGVWNELKEAVRIRLGQIIGETVDSLDKEGILNAAGRKTATIAREKFAAVAYEHGIQQDLPISNFYTDDLPVNFGEFFANIANDQISNALGYRASVFTTFYPTQNIHYELDQFLTNEINTRLDVNVTSVLGDKKLLVDQLKTQIIERIKTEMIRKLMLAKQAALEEITQEFNMTQTEIIMIGKLSGLLITKVLEQMDITKVFGYEVNALNYYRNNRGRIMNANRQARYRLTHKEERHWVLR